MKILGFFWCEWDYCIPTLIAKKYNVFFFILPSPFRRKLLLWYSVRLTLVPSTTDLTRTPYDLFGKPLFSHFHTEPLCANLSKNICHISDNYYIYKEIFKTNHLFSFFLIFLEKNGKKYSKLSSILTIFFTFFLQKKRYFFC